MPTLPLDTMKDPWGAVHVPMPTLPRTANSVLGVVVPIPVLPLKVGVVNVWVKLVAGLEVVSLKLIPEAKAVRALTNKKNIM